MVSLPWRGINRGNVRVRRGGVFRVFLEMFIFFEKKKTKFKKILEKARNIKYTAPFSGLCPSAFTLLPFLRLGERYDPDQFQVPLLG